MTPSVLIPATMLFPTNNVLVISAHYPDYEEYTVHLTFAVFGVYRIVLGVIVLAYFALVK